VTGYVDQDTFLLPEATDDIVESGGGLCQGFTTVGHDLIAMMVPNLSAQVDDGPVTSLAANLHIRNTSTWAMQGDDGFPATESWVWNYTDLPAYPPDRPAEPSGWHMLSSSSNFDDDVSGRLGQGGDMMMFYDSDLVDNTSRTAQEYSRQCAFWIDFPYIYDSANSYTTYLKLDTSSEVLENWAFDGSWSIAQGPDVYDLVPSVKYPGWWEYDGILEAKITNGGFPFFLPFSIAPGGDVVNSLAPYSYRYQIDAQIVLEFYVPAHYSNGESWLRAAQVGPDVSEPLTVKARSNLVNSPQWRSGMDMQPVGDSQAIYLYLTGTSTDQRLDGVALSTENGLTIGKIRTLFDKSLTNTDWDTAYLPESGRLARLARNQNSAVATPLNATDVRVTVVVEEFPEVGTDAVTYLADRDYRIEDDLSLTPLTSVWAKYSRQYDPFQITTGRGLYSSILVAGRVWVADINRSSVVTLSNRTQVVGLGTVAYAENVHLAGDGRGIAAWVYNWNDVPAIDVFIIRDGISTHVGRVVENIAAGVSFQNSSAKPWMSRARVRAQPIWGGWVQVPDSLLYYGVLDPATLTLNAGPPVATEFRSGGYGWATVQQSDHTAIGFSAWSTAGYQLKVSRTVFTPLVFEVPPMRLLQRDDGAGLTGHARLQLQGMARRSNSQQTGVRLGTENTYL